MFNIAIIVFGVTLGVLIPGATQATAATPMCRYQGNQIVQTAEVDPPNRLDHLLRLDGNTGGNLLFDLLVPNTRDSAGSVFGAFVRGGIDFLLAGPTGIAEGILKVAALVESLFRFLSHPCAPPGQPTLKKN